MNLNTYLTDLFIENSKPFYFKIFQKFIVFFCFCLLGVISFYYLIMRNHDTAPILEPVLAKTATAQVMDSISSSGFCENSSYCSELSITMNSKTKKIKPKTIITFDRVKLREQQLRAIKL